MIVTDSALKPNDRYRHILLDRLVKDGFILKQKKFVRDFRYGKQIIDLSFISTSGLIHCVEFYYHIIFESAEKIFKKLFGKHWTNWTVHEQLGSISNYLFDTATGRYTDKTLNDALKPFFSDIYPKIDVLNSKFKNYEQLNFEYNQFPSKETDFVPFIRFERRILMGLLLTKYFEPHKYEIKKGEYLESFEQFDPFQREQQRKSIEEGIRVLDKIDFKTSNINIDIVGTTH